MKSRNNDGVDGQQTPADLAEKILGKMPVGMPGK
jgi:hypothetical protein